MSMFEKASRLKYRFICVLGQLATEDLWSLSLESFTTASLDGIARDLARQIREEGEESFVSPKKSAKLDELTDKLEIIKHVIAVKLVERAENEQAVDKRLQKQQLLEILHDKKNESLKALSIEEIEARINAL